MSSVSSDARAIYGEDYAQRYPELYTAPWQRKHELNARNLTGVLDGLPGPAPRWLDLACGQAWHFSAFRERARMLGVDLSEAQLQRARANAPWATFQCADMTQVAFPRCSFDLVTNFWGGYCYLHSTARITALFRDAIGWIAPGGTLYIEVLLGSDLESFNRSRFAQQTGFAVSALSADYTDWAYEDEGGRHLMTSPPLATLLEVIEPSFASVEARHDGGFMVHLIASGRASAP